MPDASQLTAPRPPDGWARFCPFLLWWPRVNRVTLRADVVAGTVGAVLVLPQGIAFATLAGMPPEYGLYAAIVPTLVSALFGSSWHLMGGPTTTTSIVILSTMSAVAVPFTPHYVQLVLVMSFIVGVIKLLMGVLRLGVLVNFVSHTVVVAFTAAAGLLTIASQVRALFGISIPHGLGVLETLVHLLNEASDIDWYVVSIGLVTLGTALALRRHVPRFPYMIGAMIAGAAYAYVLTYVPGVTAEHPIAMLPALPGALPAFSAPDFSLEALRKTAPAAVIVALVGLSEAMSIARAIARRSEQRVDANQEFIGQGLANITGAFFSSYAASGSLDRSGLNYEAGAKTPLAAIFSALFLVLILMFVGPLAAHLPLAAMAAILLLVGWSLIDVQAIRKILRVSRIESAVLASTIVAALFVGLGFAIYFGVILSLILYLMRTARPRVIPADPDEYAHLFDSTKPRELLAIRVRGSIYFGSTEYVREALRSIDPDTQHDLLVDASHINFIDAAGATMLAEEARRRRKLGHPLYFYRLNEDVRRVLARTGGLRAIGRENIFTARAQPGAPQLQEQPAA